MVMGEGVRPFRLDPELVARRLQIIDSSAALAAILAEQYGLKITA